MDPDQLSQTLNKICLMSYERGGKLHGPRSAVPNEQSDSMQAETVCLLY